MDIKDLGQKSGYQEPEYKQYVLKNSYGFQRQEGNLIVCKAFEVKDFKHYCSPK